MPRKPAPRVAGVALRTLAAMVRSPVGGRQLAQVLLTVGGIEKLRRRPLRDRTRPAFVFRVAPRPPSDE
jgi:hypothetical protein